MDKETVVHMYNGILVIKKNTSESVLMRRMNLQPIIQIAVRQRGKKRNTFESVLMRWMNLEPIIQSEVSQKEKNKYRILTRIHGI